MDSEIDHNSLSGGNGAKVDGTANILKLKDSVVINNTLASGADVVNNCTMFISDHNKIELLINNNVCYTDGSNSVFSATGNTLALVAPK